MLGMGDVLSLIERAEEAIDDESRARLEQKTRLDDFTLEDFRDQLRTIKKMGPLRAGARHDSRAWARSSS